QRTLRAITLQHRRAPLVQDGVKEAARVWLIVHDQDGQSLETKVDLRLLVQQRVGVDVWREPDGEPNRDDRPASRPVAGRPDVSVVQVHQVTRDRESEAEASVPPRGTTVCLPEAVEHERQEAGIDADAGI